ncbi:WYL domain-containing protein [Cereibacter sphaeroides]|uniref:helix-turn-helix transcriptional regulator n=1 Tax=Rhodobacterales TaxID=204455 RepID=UPI000BBEC7BF|nr:MULTISPECIES: WYL domain-containing protein [Paracoccaceae]MCE6953109.1 WYL domain-containing protein [Cereibacter sphaeroides]MCE6961791.1 WYL domain-containing protein [Cereibacter sphaeroides]MCE6970566.1 WYL domain-containing protein [Cereibacter sphaeroides]MCE6975838.1 WYL domain-containing protein [Cereibacter sphaeroides]
MSFAKATDLLRLAEMAASRHFGVGLQEIEAEFEVDRRTAQRMTRALEDCFPNVETRTDDQRRKFWKLKGEDARLMLARGIRDSELAAVEMAIRRAEREGEVLEAAALRSLRDRLLSGMPGPHARRAEADAEAVLEAHGFASRPGPRVRSDPHVLSIIAEALKGPHLVTITYAGGRDEAPRERRLEPYGLLLGIRRYLVAREQGGDGRFRHFRMDRVLGARLEAPSFMRDPGFNLDDHAARAFGSYHADAEFEEVVWRFSPEAAPVAREFVFHPRQELTDEPDGALTVRFRASGWLEMAWHLYQWGDAVEVLEPEGLRSLCAGHRRADFDALP